MTLDEAIEIYEIRANTHEREAEYHRPLGYSHEAIANVAEMQAREERQIAKWLKELKERRAEQTEPQTDYERGRQDAWKIAQKVFDSTVTLYEAEDVAKQIDKDINVRSKTMRDCYNCKRYENDCECVECHYEPKTETQTDRWSEEEHKAFYTFLWNTINPNEMQDYIEMFEGKSEPQTDCSWK